MPFHFYFSLLCAVVFATFLPEGIIAPCPKVPSPDNETLSWQTIPTIDDYCFLFDFRAGKEMDYSAAVTYCETFNADDNSTARVVEPRTAALQQAIESYGSLFGGKSMWAGYNDFSEGNWKWASGKISNVHRNINAERVSLIRRFIRSNVTICIILRRQCCV